jgi:hypothetical protein
MKIEKNAFVEELWKQFKQKITRDWPLKYTEHGVDFNAVSELTNLAKSINEDMQVKLRNSKLEIPNFLTLYDYLLKDSLKEKSKNKTLDVFSLYLDYKNWADFCAKNESFLQALRANLVGQTSVEKSQIVVVPRRNAKKYALLAATTLFLSGLLYFSVIAKNDAFSDNEIIGFKDIIEEANKAELASYVSIPKIDTANLDINFTKEGLAKQMITNRIKRRADSFALDKTNSFYRLGYIGYIHNEENEVKIETDESWRLTWVNRFTQKIKSIPIDNMQYYILKYESGKWKVDFNMPVDTGQNRKFIKSQIENRRMFQRFKNHHFVLLFALFAFCTLFYFLKFKS